MLNRLLMFLGPNPSLMAAGAFGIFCLLRLRKKYGILPVLAVALLGGGFYAYRSMPKPVHGEVTEGVWLFDYKGKIPQERETGLCTVCDSLLHITSHRWASSITCPKCGTSMTVYKAIQACKKMMSGHPSE